MFKDTIQIAGIKSLNEAKLLEDLGVDLIGFPLRLNYHKPDTDEDTARNIVRQLKDRTKAVLITYLLKAKDVSEFCYYLGTSIVQLHGDIAPLEIRLLRALRPDLKIIKSLIVKKEHVSNTGALLELASLYTPWIDAFITDTFDPITSACGATGLVHDWGISRKIAENISKPLILAGGLRPDNVYEAIKTVSPDGVDSHTGVEAPDGSKSPELVEQFVREVRRGFLR